MKKFLLTALAILFFMPKIFAAPANISEDNLDNFIEKCNAIIKENNPDAYFDKPTFANTESGDLKNFVDKSISPLTITYTLKDDKIFAVMLEADKFDNNIKNYFDGLSIIYLKASGLTDTEAKNLLNNKIENSWQREGFISSVNKKYIVSFYSPILLIIAEDK